MEQLVLIVAGGLGERLNSALPKQFMEVNGKPVLMHTFDAFTFLLPNIKFVLVLHDKLIDQWKELCKKYQFNIEHQLVEGGPKRFHSVRAGLNLVPENTIVAIHDGVRPLVSKNTINNCFKIAARKGNAIPVVPVSDSVRIVDHAFNKPVDREKIKLVQTPQVFHSNLIKKAYNNNYEEFFTDDATVFESSGGKVQLVDGDRENIKITQAADMLIIEAYMKAGLRSKTE